MSGQVTITQLPTASALTGNESVPIVQNGVTVQTTTLAIAAQPVLTQTFLTIGQQSSLANSRQIAVSTGLTTTDGGAQGSYTIAVTGALASLIGSGNGFQVKTNSTTLTNVQITAGTGLGVNNPDGTTGNPQIYLGSFLSNVQSLSGSTGLVAVNGGNVSTKQIAGVTNQTSVTNADGSTGNPTVGIASNPVIPGTASLTFPIGGTASRPGTPVNGMFRYNSDTGTFEGYANGSWGAVTTGTGVTSILTGTGLLGGPITSTGTISIDTTVVATLTGTQTLTNKTISGSSNTLSNIGNSSLTNSSITINGNSVNLGGSTTVTAATTSTLTIGTGLSGTSFNGSAPVTIALANTAVSAGSYTNANITVNAQGQITAATSGSAGGVTSFQTSLNGLTPATSTTGAVTLAGTLGISSGGTGQTTASSAFNALSPITTTGDLIIGNGSNSATRLAIGANTYVLTSNGTTASWQAPSGGVTTFSAGTTGLTPSTATSGAVTLSGTLVVGNGGTGVATLTGLAYGNGTSAFTAATAAQVVSVIGTTAVTNATNATNLALTAGSGATNYITYASGATGNQPQYTSTGLTINATNSTITGGINGGTF